MPGLRLRTQRAPLGQASRRVRACRRGFARTAAEFRAVAAFRAAASLSAAATFRASVALPSAATFRASVALPAAAAVATALLAGCGQEQPTGPTITLLSAQVTQPNASGVTDAYLIVQNNGPALQLVSARTSAGGSISLRSPAKSGELLMHTVRVITIPAHSLFRLDPTGSHLLIVGSGPMQAGTEITLTLVFARHGAISVPALVTNPATGGASYFLN
jgi:copper(I)-binding protein